jgi:hypothetical protein
MASSLQTKAGHQSREDRSTGGSLQLVRDLSADIKIDLDQRRLVDRLKRAVPLNRVERNLLIEEISRGESVSEPFCFG